MPSLISVMSLPFGIRAARPDYKAGCFDKFKREYIDKDLTHQGTSPL